MHLPFISKWLERRRKAERERGVDYANAVLVQHGHAGVEILETDIDVSRVFDTYSEFEKGIQDVLRLHHYMQTEEYLEFEEL